MVISESISRMKAKWKGFSFEKDFSSKEMHSPIR
jgi:hypothetical protein